MDISIQLTTTPKAKPSDESKLGFCKQFSDHMFIMEWDKQSGWHNARIVPYGPLMIDPASPVLHYAQEIFEGMKAYRREDGTIALFRPEENALRLNSSAQRLCIPTVPVEDQVEIFKKIVEVERDWVPHSKGTSLYLRPTVIGDGNTLGVHAADRYIYFVICSPSGAYYANGLAPAKINIESRYVRAVKGGIGYAKTGGNYAASLRAAEDAKKQGFDQVLWLDGRENRFIEEVGAMNVMFVINGKLVTPALQGSILPGITRKSIIQLAQDMGMQVEERPLPVDELIEAFDSGKLQEAFGTGTAAVVSPIGLLSYRDKTMDLGGSIGSVAQKMYDILTGIQSGRVSDSYGWIQPVC